jgi:N-methylhydantoinase A/oxoprolinase/acetone carboxylase beta subunit
MDTLKKVAGPAVSADPRMTFLADIKGVVPVFERKDLAQGHVLTGPVIVSESAATSWIAPGWAAAVDQWGNLRLERDSQGVGAGRYLAR